MMGLGSTGDSSPTGTGPTPARTRASSQTRYAEAPAPGSRRAFASRPNAGPPHRIVDRRRDLPNIEAGRLIRRDRRKFANTRSEAFWTVRKLFEAEQLALPPDEHLRDELLALRWAETRSGQVEVSRKSELRERLGRSPDRADALSMACYVRAPSQTTYEPVRFTSGTTPAVEGSDAVSEPPKPVDRTAADTDFIDDELPARRPLAEVPEVRLDADRLRDLDDPVDGLRDGHPPPRRDRLYPQALPDDRARLVRTNVA